MKKPPYRVWIAVMIFFSTFTNYMMRANFTVSVGEMSEPGNITNATPVCDNFPPPQKTVKNTTSHQFKWDKNDQGWLLAAYFYGTMLTFFWGGTLAEWVGAVNVIFWTSVVTAVMTALTPIISIYGDFWATFVVRFIIGALGGPIYPALNVLTARWAPPVEKGRFLAAFMGNTIGVVITWIMVGNTTDVWGWEAGFYSVAVLMALFCVVFIILTTDTPRKNRFISQAEVEFIEQSQGGTVSSIKKIPPYKRLLTSCPYWATVAAQFGNLWSMNLMLTFAPKYFRDTLGFDLKASVVYAALPYLVRLVTSQIFGVIGDWLRKKEKLSVTKIRRLFVVFSHIIPAVCFCFVYITGCTWQAALTLLVLSQGLNGALVVGHMINCQDLSPNFSGTLYGIMNWLGGTTGFIVPNINGALQKAYPGEKAILGAAIIFLIGGIVLVITAVVFVMFGSGEVQPWNEIKEEENE